MDISSNFAHPGLPARMLDILGRDEHVDSVVMEVSAMGLAQRSARDASFREKLLDVLGEFQQRCPKPFLAVVTPGHRETVAIAVRDALTERGVPSSPSFDRAARALRKVVDYHGAREQI